MRQKVNLERTLITNFALFVIAGAITFVLAAKTNCGVALGQKGTSVANSQLRELSDMLRAEGNHRIFLSLLETAGFNFTDELRTATGQKTPPPCQGRSPGVNCEPHGLFTIFAPDDGAFAKLPAGALEALKKDPARLRSFLLSYIAPGKIMIADMLVPVKDIPGKTSLAVKNLKGEKVSILCNDHTGEHHPRINDVARIGKGDILFAGGVIHEVDQLLHINPFQ